MSEVKIKTSFPLPPGGRNHKAIREQVLLDTDAGKIAARLTAAAEAAAGPGQRVETVRTFSRRGRLSVRIFSDGEGKRKDQRVSLAAALGRVRP